MMEQKETQETPCLGEKFWEKPENILRLIDLIFFFEDNKETIPS